MRREAIDGPTVPSDLLEYEGFVRAVAAALCADASERDDIAQEVWVTVLRRCPGRLQNPKGWLRTITTNIARDRIRRHRSRMRREQAASRAESLDPEVDGIARCEVVRSVLECVMRLAPLDRCVVRMRYFEALPPAEISARLGVSVDAVKSRLARCHARLRGLLKRRHGAQAARLLRVMAANRRTTSERIAADRWRRGAFGTAEPRHSRRCN